MEPFFKCYVGKSLKKGKSSVKLTKGVEPPKGKMGSFEESEEYQETLQ